MKTRSFLLASMVILATLFITGVVFAEGEAPGAPAAEVPQAPAAEVPPELPVETPAEGGEAVVLEAAPPTDADAPALEEPADSAPTEPPAEEISTEVPAAETESPLEAPAVETALAEETIPEAGAPAVLEAAPEGLIADQATAEPLVTTMEPEIVLVDPAGEPLDMASQASADVITSADPYYTVGLITYHFSNKIDFCDAGDPYCFDGDTTDTVTGNAIQFAIDHITTFGVPNDGKIYVENATYVENIVIDAGFYPALSTLKGLIGLADPDTGVFPTISGNVSITDTTLGFTLSGFTINGRVIFDRNTGPLNLTDLDVSKPTEGGIWIKGQKGNVILTNVRSSHNAYTGAEIENTAGGNVTITNSAFDDNSGDGLQIQTNGVVTINGISASRNTANGINSWGFSSLSLKNAILNGSYISNRGLYADNRLKAAPVVLQNVTANENNWVGITISTMSSISLASVDADRNHGIGIYLNNTYETGTISLTSIRSSNNSGDGIHALSNGAITLTSVTANQNTASNAGAYLDNSTGTGNVTVTSPVASGADAANSFWGNNPGCGLKILSKGTVTVTNVEIYSNQYDGLYIDNDSGTAGITINENLANWTNDFSGNGLQGIKIYTQGIVNISSSSAFDNQRAGVDIYGKGAITLTDVSASGSLHNQPGVILNNTFGTSSGVTIKSSSSSMFYEFSHNTGNGIEIFSKGAVSVSNVITEGNVGNGIFILNNGGGDQPVNVTGSSANSNNNHGIKIVTKGTVTLTNTGASENVLGYGVTILNYEGAAKTGVTIRSTLTTKYYDFSGNGHDGIYIWSEGAVSVGNVIANENGNYGLNIDRNGGTGAISVTRGTFDHNTFGGVRIYTTPGGVTLTDVTASYNDPVIGGTEYSGVYIENGGTVVVKSSTTSAMYAFSYNTGYGLDIKSSGSISVSNVVAEDNGNTNINIENDAASITSPKPVSVTRSIANSSVNGDGFYIMTRGYVTLNTLTANENLNGFGLYVNAGDGFVLIPAAVTLTGARNEFSTNGLDGIYIETEGNISLTNAIADGNSGFGIYLYSAAYTDSTGNVTINASTNFWNSSSGNADSGVYILTNGTVTLSRLHSNENGIYGVMINNVPYSLLPKNVTLTSVEANRNRGEAGLYINSLGAVALNSTRADSNEQTGLRIYTDRAITFNGVSASYNSTHEADLPTDLTGIHATIYERLTSDAEGDIWHFVGDNNIPYTITLDSEAFDAYLKLYHWNSGSQEWELVTEDDNSFGGTDAQILRESGLSGLVTGDLYYVLATTADQWGKPGDYTLDFNSPGTAYSYNYFGAYLDNHNTTANVTITSPSNFWSAFNENNYTGLHLFTNGAVSITNTDANNNAHNGINIEGTLGPTNVTIRNTSTTRLMQISDNEGYGIHVPNAYGTITISGWILANNNGDIGVFLRNTHALDSAPKSVTITSLTSSDNEYAGIYVDSKGAITLSSITASNNQGDFYGVRIENAYSPNSSITINGSNIISGNMGSGLIVSTNGIVSITGVRAENNYGDGLELSSYTDGKSVK